MTDKKEYNLFIDCIQTEKGIIEYQMIKTSDEKWVNLRDKSIKFETAFSVCARVLVLWICVLIGVICLCKYFSSTLYFTLMGVIAFIGILLSVATLINYILWLKTRVWKLEFKLTKEYQDQIKE